jgi:N-acetylglucosaminyl-diphospho-decaprenol L-rhamnosyltransferase
MAGVCERRSIDQLMGRGSPSVTVAVVNWNTRELLSRCLDSLRAPAGSGVASVIVVDNGSTDGSPQMVRTDHPWAELIEPIENLGFGRAVNLAATRSNSPWVAAANADIEVSDGALETLLEAGRRNPEIGAIAPRLVLPDGSTQHSVHRFPSPALAAIVGLALYRLSPSWADRLCLEGFWDPDRRRQVDWAHGAFLLLRREVFDRVGGFDESQWMYAEDIDIGWRLRRSGHPVLYEPEAAVRHALSASARQAFGDVERDARHTAASYIWLARRRGTVVARATAALNITGAALRLLAFAPLARLAPGRWKMHRDEARRFLYLHRRGLAAIASEEALVSDQPE